jgi:hypothetical protein
MAYFSGRINLQKEEKMKLSTVVAAAICLFVGTIYAADDCDSEYLKLIEQLEDSTQILEREKQKYLPPIKKNSIAIGKGKKTCQRTLEFRTQASV